MPTATQPTIDVAPYLELEFGARGALAFLSLRGGVNPRELDITAPGITAWLLDQGLDQVREDRIAAIVQHWHDTGLGFRDELVADHGIPARDGENARLDWLVDPEAAPESALPAEGESADFFAMADFRAVRAGQVFARVIPATAGVPGVDVKGRAIAARDGAPLALQPGRDVSVDSATGEWQANQDGRIEVCAGRVHISRVLDIPRDVDYSTGSVRFSGMVNVPGCVRDNFSIDAEDGVCVRGVVEAAQIHCGGSIALIGGMNARDRGLVEAQGDLTARFITNGDARARGEVRVRKEIVSSRVHGRTVRCDGAVKGGSITAWDWIRVREAGNPEGVKTVLAVNHDLWRQLELEQTQARIAGIERGLAAIRANLAKIEPIRGALKPATAAKVEALAGHCRRLEAELVQAQSRVPELARPERARHGWIEFENGIHPGVVLRIGRYEKAINQHFPGRRRAWFDESKFEIVVGV